jgi:hypothetical protein
VDLFAMAERLGETDSFADAYELSELHAVGGGGRTGQASVWMSVPRTRACLLAKHAHKR